jgi:hypothetical protein
MSDHDVPGSDSRGATVLVGAGSAVPETAGTAAGTGASQPAVPDVGAVSGGEDGVDERGHGGEVQLHWVDRTAPHHLAQSRWGHRPQPANAAATGDQSQVAATDTTISAGRRVNFSFRSWPRRTTCDRKRANPTGHKAHRRSLRALAQTSHMEDRQPSRLSASAIGDHLAARNLPQRLYGTSALLAGESRLRTGRHESRASG